MLLPRKTKTLEVKARYCSAPGGGVVCAHVTKECGLDERPYIHFHQGGLVMAIFALIQAYLRAIPDRFERNLDKFLDAAPSLEVVLLKLWG